MGSILEVRKRIKGVKGRTAYMYKNDVDGEDFRQVALILLDLEREGVPIEKAIKEYKRIKSGEFPW